MKRLLWVVTLMLMSSPAVAAPILSITPITWDVIGLDSNNQTVGPNVFPVGARVCNTGDTAATNVTASFVRTGLPNLFITVQGASSIVTATLPAGAAPPSRYSINFVPANCTDFYFNLAVTRTFLAFNTIQGYRISVTADNAAGVMTPANRQLYIERLISQNRNTVLSFTGPSTVYVGGTYQYTVTAKTATGGYEQIENFPNFPNTIFRIIRVATSYAQPVGAVNSTVYGDACGWNPNVGLMPPLGTYLSCVGPTNYAGGKAGDNLTSVYTVQILSTGSATVSNVIYDYSGSSYHYNSDFGDPIESLTITALAPAAPVVVKSAQTTFDPVNTSNFKAIPGALVAYTLQVSNTSAGRPDNNSVVVVDAVPANTDLYVGDAGSPGSGPVVFSNGTPASGVTYTWTALNSGTDDISFSNNGGATFVYTPSPNAFGADPAVTHIRVNPKGQMNANTGAGNPNFSLIFKVRVE